MEYEDFSAWIDVEGTRLEQYKIERDEETRTVRCYVASEVDKEFSVHWKANRRPNATRPGRTPAIRTRLKVDGHACQKILTTSGRGNIISIRVDEDSNLRVCPRFGQVQLTDEESAESVLDEHAVKALGSIELMLEFGYAIPRAPREGQGNGSTRLPEAKPIYEKLKKAGSHQVTAGKVSESGRLSSRSLRGHKPEEDIKFVFLYRSRELLLAQEIIPPEEEPAREREAEPARERSATIKDEEDAEGELLREQALEAQLAAIRERRQKRQLEVSAETRAKRPKIEEIQAKLFFQSGEVIDLTSD